MNSKFLISMSVFLTLWGLMIGALYYSYEPYVYIVLGLGCLFQLSRWGFHKRALFFMLLVGLFGWSLESLESHFEVLKVMGSHPQPLWLGLLWAYYVPLSFDLFNSFVNRYWKAFLYGVYSLPGSYYFVSKLGLVEICDSLVLFFLINGTVGGLVLVFSHSMYYSLKVDKL